MELQHKLLLVSICLLLCTAVAISRPEGEAEALLRWRSTLLESSSLSSWSLCQSHLLWFGVSCDAAGHVTSLRLPGAGINGKLDAFYSPAFQNLTRLGLRTTTSLSSNSLTGAIPYQLSKLPRLAVLNLANNHLTNPEYGKLSPMSSLKSLSLANNDLDGTFLWLILNCTGRLQQLRFLYLHNNNLTGGVPEGVGDGIWIGVPFI
ncbi:hypothetical protein HU200_003623 [Digitaria exilis]|uniref:Leucine-rich repeat-containing N-terminal plant-type domain-containing protein n=1 Tax=Digitaria exilis TaxID=1010633 RepID=A0A835FTW6_9POAL|nr:hypothetical protein HU200_003623 [Digitaria exilis]